MPKPAIFLDRDGTLIVERNYLSDPVQVEHLPAVTVEPTLAEVCVAHVEAGGSSVREWKSPCQEAGLPLVPASHI